MLIITADIIRKYPFGVSPRRITPDLELLIAQDMAEAARKEGHRKAVPPTIVSKEAQKEATRRRIEAQVLACLETHGPKHFNAIRDIVRRDTQNLSDALNRLLEAGLITAKQRKASGGGISHLYAINPSYSPTQGQCDQAHLGNPTGTRSDVTTVEPLTGPGALEPLPANGGPHNA